ncbi:MAG: glycosyltransferase family 4 protein [Bacteroidales bacterium]
MNILIIHNQYSARGGEETMVEFQKNLLEHKGHKIILYTRHYNEMKKWRLGIFGGMFTAIYNPRSIQDLKKIIAEEKLDLAILHNLLPIISPAIIPFLKKKGIKTIQVLHNYRLLCPIGLFYIKDTICEQCTTKGREWHCFKNRCNGSILASASFAIRNYLIRKLKYFRSIDIFLALSNFQKQKLQKNGFEKAHFAMLPNAIIPKFKDEDINLENKTYVGFVGRLTKEKGIFDFIEVAKRMPHIEFRIAGNKTHILEDIDIPSNLHFEGFLSAKELKLFYQKAKLIFFPSHLYEGFPMILLEAFDAGTPIIAYNFSVMPEIIENEKQGFIVERGNVAEASQKIDLLFKNPSLYQQISLNCRAKFAQKYTAEVYYKQLMKISQTIS